jgi:hypothetical protein
VSIEGAPPPSEASASHEEQALGGAPSDERTCAEKGAVFNKNFMESWRPLLKKTEEGKEVKDLALCDFSKIKEHLDEIAAKKKELTAAEKKAAKIEKDKFEEPYLYALVDGRKEKVGNFRVEPPGLFRGRGEHPKMGILKRRVQPEDVSINVSDVSKAPAPPAGHPDALALERRWPLLAADDLDRPAEGSDRLGKACEFCLAEDSAEGRDHYLRQDWRLAWRMSCRRHGSPLVDVETFDLVPVVIDGQRERRVRLLRDFEKTVDRFLRRARGGGFNRQIIPAAALCLEADIDAALDGRRLPALWCLGSDWPRARRSHSRPRFSRSSAAARSATTRPLPSSVTT